MYSLNLLLGLALIAGVASNSSEDGSLGKTGEKTTNCTCGWRGQVEDKIVGGELAGEGEFPSQVRIYTYNETLVPQCGGTILTEKYVLMNILCLRDQKERIWIDKSLLRVCYGKANTTGLQESDTLKVEKFIPYDMDWSDYVYGQSDIALLKVLGKFEFGPNVGPACFPTVQEPMKVDEDVDVIATGYGFTEWNSMRKPVKTDLLHKVHLNREWDLRTCNSRIRLPIFNSQRICTMTPGKSICRGDFGGPLFFYDKEMERYVLVGVASFSSPPPNGCSLLGGFMKVGYFRQWILKTLSEEGENLCMKQ